MRTYRKTLEAVSKLTPEQYRVTQTDGTERRSKLLFPKRQTRRLGQ